MSRGIFITATGTDIGKTYISALIVKLLHQNGINVGYYKAALSGANLINNNLIPGDCKFVTDTAKLNINPIDLVSYVYKTAVSPHLAARLEGNPIETSVIKYDFNKIKECFDYITVEGSGGIICPLRLDNKKIMLVDIIKILQLDIIIVASSELGTINNTILTIEYAKNNGINIKGIILNNYDKNNFLHVDNKKSIELLTEIPIIACVASNDKSLNIDVTTLCNLYKEV